MIVFFIFIYLFDESLCTFYKFSFLLSLNIMKIQTKFKISHGIFGYFKKIPYFCTTHYLIYGFKGFYVGS